MFNSYLYILSVDCTVPDISSISMLSYMVDGLMPGSTITYSCDGDYYLPDAADSVQVCLQSGEWSGTVPTACVIGTCVTISWTMHSIPDFLTRIII